MCERNRFIKKRRQPWLLVEDEEMPEAEDPPTPRQLQPGAQSKIVTVQDDNGNPMKIVEVTDEMGRTNYYPLQNANAARQPKPGAGPRTRPKTGP